MSWHFLQEQEEASWAENSLDGAPFALLSLLSIPGECYSPDNATDFCQPSQSGTTCELLTESDGKAASMSLAGGFLAKTLAWPGKDWDWLANAPGFGVKCSGSFAKWNRDSYSWRTAQCSLFEDLEQSLEIWPRWGLMRGGECWALPMLEPRICESASGLWPTPCKMDQTNSMPWIARIYEIKGRKKVNTISSNGIEATSPLRAWAAALPRDALQVGEHWPPEPGMARMVHGLADGVDRIGALGNGQVPRVVAIAWRVLTANSDCTDPRRLSSGTE